MKSKVSIIVPIYNAGQYIKGCLDSLLKQSLKEIEVICVNDGSTDDSLEILQKYQKSDSRVTIISQKNKGRSMAREAGLEKVKTPYVMFCDADDQFDLTMCEKMVDAIEGNGVDLVVCGMKMMYETHQEMRESDENYYRLKFDGKRMINDRITLETNGSVCNKIFRVDKIRENGIGFPKGLGTGEDHYFYCAYMSVSRTIYYLNRKLYKYVRHEGSTMSINFEKRSLALDDLLVAEELFKFYKKTGFLKNHENLFWAQWVGGFWASYRYSEKQYRGKVLKMGREFISKNYDNHKPSDSSIQNRVKEIISFNIIFKIKRRLREILKRIYLKVNFGYRQQNFINLGLEDMHERLIDLSERTDYLIKENK